MPTSRTPNGTPNAAGGSRGKALTDVEVRAAKPADKRWKLHDQRGLFLLITPAGTKLWRFKYRFRGREKLLAFGAYPEVSLADARSARDRARAVIAAGDDPAARRKAERSSDLRLFEAVAREWFDSRKKQWSEKYAAVLWGRLERYVLPDLGERPIGKIAASEMLDVLLRTQACGVAETTRRVKQAVSHIFTYAIAKGDATADPTFRLERVLDPLPDPNHFPAITEPAQVAGLLRVLNGYAGTIIVRSALRLAPRLFVRPGELRRAEWSEIDWNAARWVIPAERMKMRRPHIVPLSRQSIYILRELHAVTGKGRYVFPSGRRSGEPRPMSDNAVLAALRCCGISADVLVGHGFRAMARTLLDEELGFRVDIIEHQLSHEVKDPTGRAYNRTAFLRERTVMMQRWTDYLDDLSAGVAPEEAAAKWHATAASRSLTLLAADHA